MFILHLGARHYVCVFKCVCVCTCVCVCMHVFVSGPLNNRSLNCMGPLMWIFSTKYIQEYFLIQTWLNVWIWRTDLLLHLDFWLGEGWHPQPPCVLKGSAVFIYVCVCMCVRVCVCVWDRFSFNFQNQLYTVGTIVLQFIDTETELENSVGHPKSHTRWNTQSHPSCTEKVDNVKEKPP